MIRAQLFKMITDTGDKIGLLDSDKLGKYLRLWKRKEIELSMLFVSTRQQYELKDLCRQRALKWQAMRLKIKDVLSGKHNASWLENQYVSLKHRGNEFRRYIQSKL